MYTREVKTPQTVFGSLKRRHSRTHYL